MRSTEEIRAEVRAAIADRDANPPDITAFDPTSPIGFSAARLSSCCRAPLSPDYVCTSCNRRADAVGRVHRRAASAGA